MEDGFLAATKQLYAERGYLVMSSARKLDLGPLEDSDWNEDDMAEFRWMVIGVATREEMHEQQRLLGYTLEIHPNFRWFYRIEAMD